MKKEDHEIKLKEQHRNTRHDSIDEVQRINKRWDDERGIQIDQDFVNEIVGAIMNLKQRKP